MLGQNLGLKDPSWDKITQTHMAKVEFNQKLKADS